MDEASPCRLEHAQATYPSPKSQNVIPLSLNLSLLNERGNKHVLSVCLILLDKSFSTQQKANWGLFCLEVKT